jgi:NADH-ubiquinone oxidoreductase chain 6
LINLFFVNEILSNKYSIEALDALSIFIVICGIYTIISKNPIVSILYLIGLFGGVSSYLILIGLSFIGLSYIIIYVGAVSILFLFILMLINIRISELQNNTKNSLVLALIILIFFNYSVIQTLPYSSGVLSYSERDIVLSANVYENTNNQNLLSESFTTSGKNSDIYLTSSND